MWRRRLCVWLILILSSSFAAAENPRHIDLPSGITTVGSVEQNWKDDVSNQFYNMPQGSRIVPYDWFLNLEQADSQTKFRDATNIRALGYIPRTPDPLNPDGLPIGFIKDVPYEDGTTGLGMTCAACHTNQIRFGSKAWVIDGAPTLADFERFHRALAAALKATSTDDAKFARFAGAVLPATSSDTQKMTLRSKLDEIARVRAEYNERDLPKSDAVHFGPGRVDAFGAIFNEVAVTFLGLPQNWNAADAPVSYPCLWDTPQHDYVQWNGAAENKENPLGEVLFRTKYIGAQGRNAGEVLGVFGNTDIALHDFPPGRPYDSTVNRRNLIQIESSLRDLWSPLWPEDDLGAINNDAKLRGKALFKDQCWRCHQDIDRTDPNRRVKAQLSQEGTDNLMIANFGRTATTGRLKGRRKTLLGLERFSDQAPIPVILKHVVERVILDPSLNPLDAARALAEAAAGDSLNFADALNPGYRLTATIEIGGQKLVGRFDSLIKQEQQLIIGGGRFHLMDRSRDVQTNGLGDNLIDLRSATGVQAAINQIGAAVQSVAIDPTADASAETTTAITADSIKIGYKARPLNGVWATAPYLHNGSVPTLAELLKPAAERIKTFHVGSQEYDPVNVGYKDAADQPLFDTSLHGNSNAGHEYGTSLTPAQKMDLLEYLKSL